MNVVFPEPKYPINRQIRPFYFITNFYQLIIQFGLFYYNQMSVSNKDFYFLTNRSTFFRYFVDNSSGKPQKYLFYPKKYQTMTSKQIEKFEFYLSIKYLWWSLWNKQKMLPGDYKICLGRVFDFTVMVLSTLLLAKVTRKFLFRQQLIGFERFMDEKNMDTKFWKAVMAYTVSFPIGFIITKQIFQQTNIKDLAFQYSPNFTQDLIMPEIQPILNKAYKHRFPWLYEKKND